ncbi:type III secretion system cytoplasmic ring protein SctQ [Bosea sp. (in: a-proteobacteria)]|jgi:type III secretion protein Q|uniref:type III secretion system cytoplasmic ring protein SctQ n=1 Tax=Bosea sp. (in: a-proteobacteria) TaxID=1871050 RepID=UPI003F71839A
MMSVSILPARHERIIGFSPGTPPKHPRFEPQPVLSRAVVAWINAVVVPRAPWTGRLGDRAVSLGIGSVNWDWAPAPGPMLDFVWEAGGTSQVLSLSRPIADGLLEAVQPGLALPSEPSRSLVLELALEPLLARFETQAGQELRLVEVRDAVMSGPYLALELAFGQLNGQARLFLPTQLDCALPTLFDGLAALAARQPERKRELSADFPMIVATEIGSLRIGSRLLHEARPGDVLLPEDCPLLRGEVTLAAGGLWAPAEQAGNQLRLRGRFRPRSIPPESARMSQPPEPAQPPNASLDEVEVTLVFECGRWPITLGALRSAGDGHVFDLGRPLDGPVDILANGRRIGRGDIVRVGDTLGVRLLGGLAGND